MSLFPVLSHQDERTDEGGGHQGGLWPQDLQTGESCEVNGLKFLLNNLFVMGNRVKSLPSCGQLMWWWKSGTIREFAQINHPKWAMSEISIWYLKHSKYHIVNQKMTTFEMLMKNEATCERLLRLCISGGPWPKYWWKIWSTLVVKLYDSFLDNSNAFWIFITHIAGRLCSRDWIYSKY